MGWFGVDVEPIFKDSFGWISMLLLIWFLNFSITLFFNESIEKYLRIYINFSIYIFFYFEKSLIFN